MSLTRSDGAWLAALVALLVVISGAATASGLAADDPALQQTDADAAFAVDGIPESPAPGEEFTVDVALDTTVGADETTVTGAEFQLSYDTELLTVTNVSDGAFLQGQLVNDTESGLVDVGVASEGSGSAGSGTVVEVTFVVTEDPDAPVGAETPLMFETTGALDGNDESITTTATDATVPTEDTHPPTAALEANVTSGVEVGVDAVELNATGSADNHAIDRYEWDLTGDGTVDVTTSHPNATVEHVFSEVGSNEVTVTVVDEWGNTAEASQTVDVQDTQAPTAAINGPEQVDAGDSVTFNASETTDNGNVVTYEWDFGDGTTRQTDTPTVDHEFTESGTYTVSVTAVDAGNNTDTASLSVEALPADPEAQVEIAPDPVNVTGADYEEPVTLDASGSVGENLTYEWTFHDDVTATGETTSRTYDERGEYDVTLNVTDEFGQSDETTVTVTVVDEVPPSAALDASTKSGIEVGVDAVTFDAGNTTDNDAIDRYEWDLTGNGSVDVTTDHPNASVEHVFSEIGRNQVTVTAIDASGNADQAVVNVDVEDTTPPTGAVQVPDEVIAGAPAAFNATGSTDNHEIDTYEWDFTGDGTVDVTGPTPEWTFDDPGNYDVTLNVTDAAGNENETTVTVDVLKAPRINITDPASEAFVNTSTPTVGYDLANTDRDNASAVQYRVVTADGTVAVDWTDASFTETADAESLSLTSAALDDGTYTVELRILADGEPLPYASATAERTITVDTTAPTIDLDSPEEGTVPYDTVLNFTVDDAHAVDTVYETNTSVTSPTSLAAPYEIDVAAEGWPEGPTAVTVRATDEAGNVAEETVTVAFRSDPAIDSVEPEGELLDTRTPTVNVTYSDDDVPGDSGVDPDSVALTVDGNPVDLSEANRTADGLQVQLPELTLDDPDDSTHTLTVTVADEAGYTATESWEFTVDVQSPRVGLDAAADGAANGYDHVGEQNPATIDLNVTDTHFAAAKVEVRDDSGTVVYDRDVTNRTGDGQDHSLEWDAVTNDGTVASSGEYEIAVVAADDAGNVAETNRTVTVDTTTPNATVRTVEGGLRDGDTLYLNDTSEVTTTVEADDGEGDAVENVDVTISADFTTYRVTAPADHAGSDTEWNVTLPTDVILDEGAYTIRTTATDRARNTNRTTAAETIVYDDSAPRLSAVLELENDSDTGDLRVRANEPLANDPDVSVTTPNGSTITPTLNDSSEQRWTYEFNASADGSYAVEAIGTDRAGNTGSDTTTTSIERVSTQNRTVIVLNEDTGTFIRFNTTEDVENTFVTVSESDVPPEELDESRYGVGFLTSQLGAELDASLANATIHVPMNESELPGEVTATDVNITYYNETRSEWEDVDTTVREIDETVSTDEGNQTVTGTYWTTTVDQFSTYGTTTTDDAPPKLVAASPEDGTTVAWDTDSVNVTFDYADELSGVNVSSVSVTADGEDVTDESGTQITSNATTHAVTLTQDDLDTSKTVTVTVADEAGNEETFAREFTVEAPPAPSLSPIDDGETYAAGTEQVDIAFDYSFPGLAHNVSASSITVTDETGSEVPLDGSPTWGSNSVTATVPVENGTSYTAEVTVVDEWGHERTETLSLSVEEPADDTDDGTDDEDETDEGPSGGGGGGGGAIGDEGPSADFVSTDTGGTVLIEAATGGDTIDVDFGTPVSGSGVSVESTTLDMWLSIDSFRIEVTHPQTDPVGGAPALETAEPVSYLTIDAIGVGSEIDSASIGFSVDEARLPEGSSPEDVRLFRYADGEWQELETEHHGGNSYTAETPGFSPFAVGVVSAEQAEGDVQVTDAQVSSTSIAVDEAVDVTGTVENTGGSDATTTVDLVIDGETVDTQEVDVAAGDTEEVTFTHTFEAAGSYDVALNDVTAGTVDVTDDAPSGTAQPTPTDDSDLPIPGFGPGIAVLSLLVAGLLARRLGER